MTKRWQQKRTALGSDTVLTIVAEDSIDASTIFAELWQQIDEFEARFSRFRSKSELTRVNHRAGTRVATVSSEFRDLLLACQAMSELTGGLFNPFVLPKLQEAGYQGSWPRPQIYDEQLNYEDRQEIPTAKDILIDGLGVQIPAASALDFGGIGKGYLLDQLSESLTKYELTGYWLSLGGDILCAGQDLDNQSWSIAIANAQDDQSSVGKIANTAGRKLAIATSGITKRKGTHNGRQWHHLIDPRSGNPASTDILTTTVTADTAVEADVYAKCFVIVGSAAAAKLLSQLSVRDVYNQTRTGKLITYAGQEELVR